METTPNQQKVLRAFTSMRLDAEEKLAQARKLLSKNDGESFRQAAMAAECAAAAITKLYNLEGRINHVLAATAE
jgi:hypothetical protein